jgi:hypothetical protein
MFTNRELTYSANRIKEDASLYTIMCEYKLSKLIEFDIDKFIIAIYGVKPNNHVFFTDLTNLINPDWELFTKISKDIEEFIQQLIIHIQYYQ